MLTKKVYLSYKVISQSGNLGKYHPVLLYHKTGLLMLHSIPAGYPCLERIRGPYGEYYFGVLYPIPNRRTDAVCITKMEQAIAGNLLLDMCCDGCMRGEYDHKGQLSSDI